MSCFSRTAQAEEDLIDIWTYIARDSEAAADQFIERLDERCCLLAEQPGLA